METTFNSNEMAAGCFDLYDMMIVITNLEGEVVLMNEMACERLGYDNEVITGKLWTELLVADEDIKLFEDFRKHNVSNEEKEIRIARFRISTKNGDSRFIEFKMEMVEKEDKVVGIFLSGKDMTDYMNIQQDLYQSISLHRMLAASVPGINMYLIDKDMRFVIAEGTEMKKHGLSPDFFEGKTLTELDDRNMEELLKPLFKCALEGTELTTESIFNDQHYNISVFPLFNSNGEVYGGMLISQNITEEKETAKRLSMAKKEAESANKAKSEFLANISHELRTPLSAIVGFTEQLLKQDLNPKQNELAQIIEKSTEQLQALVDDLLILSRIEAGRIKLDDDPFRINDVLEYIYRFMKVRADEKEIEFVHEIDPGLKQLVLGDELRLNQILTNLVGNAIKFTDKGRVKIRGGIEYETEDQLFVCFEVSDTGVGIAKDKLDVIFEQFRQAHSAITKKYGGTGLGLSISKRLVDALGGAITVKSEIGVGTGFKVRLPYEKGDESFYYKNNSTEQKISFEGKEALLVDDDRMIRLLGKIILENLGFKVELAEGGAEAIEHLNNKTCDVLILDIHMPGVSGIDVAHFLRQVKRNKSTKILAVTAAFMKKDIQKYRAAGIDDYMSKPFKENKLCTALQKLLGSEKIKTGNEKEISLLRKNDNAYDLSELRSMAGKDDVFLLSMLDTFTINVEEGLEKIKKTVPEKDWKSAGEVAHKLLPSFVHLKVKGIVPLLKKLETTTRTEANPVQVEEIILKIVSNTEKVLLQLEKEKKNLRD